MPCRAIDMQNPNKYGDYSLGERAFNRLEGSCLWLNTDRVWNVNGCVFKADGNFLNHFFFNRVGATPIFIGSYPTHEMDYARLGQAGVTAVLNIMDETDHRQHGASSAAYQRMANQAGITVYHNVAVSDDREEEYIETCFAACRQLHALVNEQ
jgi:hypothetical protein